MARGNNYPWWRQAAEALEDRFYAGGWAARIAYAVGLQGQLAVDRRDLRLPFRSELPEPLRVAFASDIHAGPLTDPRLIDVLFRTIAHFDPHVVLFGGDFVSLDHRYVDDLAEQLDRLRAPAGMFGVLGNHDLWLGHERIGARLQEKGVRILVNEAAALPPPYDEIWICGLDDPGSGQPDPAVTFRDAGRRRILLMHSPMGLPLVQDYPFDLALCGHTHGGQIAFPWGRPIILPRHSGERRYSNGRFDLPEGGVLVASRGVGMSDLPIRWSAPSEVHLYTLRACD
ncbi:MAG TPA: metallophosphoesterase [Rhodocyclaceae bacterium]|nr:metallophosphoesterase [Rhodocyclaceae bacterium]